MKRIVRVTAVGAVALTLIPAHAGAKAAEPPLDTMAALLMPADVETLGYADYGADMGSLYSIGQLFQMAGVLDEVEPGAIEATGITSFASVDLNPIPEDGEQAESWTSFFSMITLFVDEETAAEDFSTIREDYGSDGTEIIDDDSRIGDDSFMYQDVDESAQDGTTTTITVSFQLGSVEVEVSVIGINEEADPDLALDTAEIVAEKLESLMETGEIDGEPAPGLSLAAPRYAGESLNPGRSEYDVIDGEAIGTSTDPDAVELLQDRVDEYGIDAQFATAVEYKLGTRIADYDPRLHFQVTTFDSARDAERYVDDRYGDLSQTEELDNLDEVRVSLRTYEDGAATALTYETTVDGNPFENIRLFIQDGRSVYDVTLTGFEPADLDVVTAMLDDMLGCGQNSCVDTLEPPAELMNYFEAQAEIWENQFD
jgi:hypothetical protein